MFLAHLAALPKKSGYVLEGFPRTLSQANALNTFMTAVNWTLRRVVYLDVPEAELVSRISGRQLCKACGAVYGSVAFRSAQPGICDVDGSRLVRRDDDHADVVRGRLALYSTIESAVKEHYSAQGLMAVVDGHGEPGVVGRAILKLVGP